MHTDIHVSSGIRTHDPSARAGEDWAATVIVSNAIMIIYLPRECNDLAIFVPVQST
jgi:hypothetical protein